ncbi:sulfite exporter TauE/SafE family protein [Schaalia sp. Marseille-Q2122]|uniref:sulfite exporter TauE/SafE family protein n=1 Tax=Schaalia sp. Marseille-Q2122 TaxID=2736604 RepID=UPI00158E2B49|nr:sulfite exporter TauE/SafE family protein [Schaalia sp. Marseille-Q2122]
MTDGPTRKKLTPGRIAAVIGIGIAAGFLAGLFGVGGGMMIVPALVLILDMSQRQAAATSLSSIVITTAVGSISYATQGQVSLPAMLLVAGGALVGAQIGTWLLRVLPERILPWIFVGFAAMIIIIHQLHESVRTATIEVTVASAIAMIGVGLVSGVFAGLVGVGGGGIIVPGLEIVVGAGDLIARGTSLLAMIPTALSGTYSNLKHGLVDLPVGLIIGAAAASTTPLGLWAANAVSPRTGSYLFGVFLVAVSISTVLKARARRARG